MSITVKIPTQLRQLIGGEATLDVTGAGNVKELIEKLGADHPGLVERIIDEQGEIRRFINIYVGQEDVRFLQGLDTKLEESGDVSILPAVAGGD